MRLPGTFAATSEQSGHGPLQGVEGLLMIVRPRKLEEWTLALVNEIAASGAAENDWYDFKGDLQPADHQRKPVAAFANTQGGFLVFGVSNDRQVRGVKRPELPLEFGNAVRTGLYPSASFCFLPPLPVDAERCVWVCEVPRSSRGPHGILMNQSWVYLRRTEAGSNESMNVEETRAAFRGLHEKLSRLRFLRSEVERIFAAGRECRVQGERARIQGWHAPLPEFRMDTALGLLPDLFDLIHEDPHLIKQLQSLAASVRRADNIFRRWEERAMEDRKSIPTPMVLASWVKTAGEGIDTLAERALAGLRRIEASLSGSAAATDDSE